MMKIETNNQRPLTIGQRAMAAARRMKDLAPFARQRQRAGMKTSSCTKGKASALAAAEQGISPRIAEMARLVDLHCIPEVKAAVESDQISISAAAKLAKALPGVQRQAIGEVIKGRRAVEVLAEIGVQDRRLPRFDDDVFEKCIHQFKRLLDLRRATLGDHPSCHAARARLEELRTATRHWTLTGPKGPPPPLKDLKGFPLPERLNAALRFRGQIENACYDIGTLSRQIAVLSRHDGGQCIPVKEIEKNLTAVQRLLVLAFPDQVCHCRGYSSECSDCFGRGWLPHRGFIVLDPYGNNP